MKEYGKFEKRPKAANLLLQTYFTSLISLVLCVSLFFGTSYAWFTSEVTNTANEIYVGTLKVGLSEMNGRDLVGTDNKLFDRNIRWEPGYTSLDTLHISNLGDLAFKYVLSFTDGSVSGGNTTIVNEVAECFEVWVYDHTKNNAAPSPKTYSDITEANGWSPVGDLDELLAGKPVLSGQMENVRGKVEGVAPNAGTTDGVATEHTYTVALHMKEEAGANVMGCNLKLNVKLVAYQMVSEADAMGNKGYDEIMSASTADQLYAALNNGQTVVLVSNIEMGSTTDGLIIGKGTLDGNRKTISYTGDKAAMAATGGTVQNLNINAGNDGCALYVAALSSNLTVTDCVLTGKAAFDMEDTVGSIYTLAFIDTQFNNNVSYGNGMAHVRFEECTIGQLLTAGGDTTMSGCIFNWASLDVSKLQAGETITMVDCKYAGTQIEKAVLTAGSDGITIQGTDKLIIQNGQVVLK